MSLPSADRPGQRLRRFAILPILAHLGLLIVFDLDDHVVVTLLLVAAGFLGLYLAERQLRDRVGNAVWWPLLAVAILLRCLLLPLPPTLSGDVERYVWDGRVLTHGFNPYELAPDATELSALRDPLWESLEHRQVPTVYPPLAEGLFAISALLPSSVYALKTLLVILDLGTCALLLVLARLWSLSPSRVLWYAWNPLVTVEIAGMGHVDGLGVALVVLTTTLLALSPGKSARASIAAAGAVLTKLVPVLAIPVWGRQSDQTSRFVVLAGALVLVGLMPVWISTGGPPPGLVEYAASWEFNGPLFEPLWRVLDRVDLRAVVETGLNRLKESSGNHEFWNGLYQYNYPQLWAKGMLSLGLFVGLIWSWRTDDTAKALGRVFGCVLIFSATVYPWYALWVLPWAALRRHPAWLALSGLLFFSYIPQFLDVPLFPWVQILIWLPFMVVMSMGVRWSMR